MNPGQMSIERFRELVFQYGTNSNAFLGLYPGYEYFCPERIRGEGGIAFLETRRACIGVAEPVAQEVDMRALLVEFANLAYSRGKAAMLIPVSLPVVKMAKTLGYGSLKIGGEPIFSLGDYRPDLEMISTAKRLYAKGARVFEVLPDQIDPERKKEFDTILEDWMGTRKMSSLAFVNRVEPWILAADRKYFFVWHNARTLAFVAAVPIPARHGWYFVDVCRRREAPPGSTELLILEAMRLLKVRGAEIISMGVAPLSDLDLTTAPSYHRLVRFLDFVYEHGGLFYNFESLHQFKLKFRPTHVEPAFLIFHPARLGLSNVLGLSEAFLGKSLVRAFWTGVNRQFSRWDWNAQVRQHLDPMVVTRPLPRRVSEAIARCPLTFLLIVANLLVYFLTVDPRGRLLPSLVQRYSFSLQALEDQQFLTIVVSPFLHWGPAHLVLNLMILFLFVGLMELLAGSFLTAAAYLVPNFLANAVSVLFFSPLRLSFPQAWEAVRTAQDVGASLGIFGCLGGVSLFFRPGKRLGIWLSLATALYALLAHDFLSLNHIAAMAMGIALTRSILGRARLIPRGLAFKRGWRSSLR
jgi:membrane associated rhomboid family serine protease